MVSEAVFDDWYFELKEFPAWAIQNACRFYISRDNPDLNKKPICGQISKIAEREFVFVKVAELQINKLLGN